tara:strand:+ start:6642 stop:7103 length:462 start_codon:yes stop_codon:yes gene_type:complete
MFYHLLNREYRIPFLVFAVFGIGLFWIDAISEWLILQYTGIDFTYAEPAHLKLVYILLAVVLIGITSAVNANENKDPNQIRSNYMRWVLLIIGLFLIGEMIHIWMVSDVLTGQKSMMELEDNVFLYFIADYLLFIGFAVGGLVYIRPLIHQTE